MPANRPLLGGARIVQRGSGFGKGSAPAFFHLDRDAALRDCCGIPGRSLPMHRRFLPLALACAVLLPTACAHEGAWVELGGERFVVEVADDDQERARGLMFRDRLEDGHGML